MFFLAGKSQSATVELYDLVRSLLPDSTASPAIVPWNQQALKSENITWQSNTPVNNENKFSMRGNLILTINGNSFSCDVKNTRPCPFQLFLEGTEKGYSIFSIDHLASTNVNPEQSIAYLFNQPLRSKLLKKNRDTGNIILYTYEIRMTGKRAAWLKYACMKSEIGNAIYLKIYLNEKDMIDDEAGKNEPGKSAL